MGLVIVPIIDEKVDDWKNWSSSLSGNANRDFDHLNERYGLERHDVWYAETPSGPVAVVLHEGPGADRFMEEIAGSTDPYDLKFKAAIEEFHGFRFDEPMDGPVPQKMN